MKPRGPKVEYFDASPPAPAVSISASSEQQAARYWLDICIGRLVQGKDEPVSVRAALHDAVTEAIDDLIDIVRSESGGS